MITLKDWMECVGYRITEGSEYLWKCFGDNVRTLDSWDGNQTGVSSSVVFGTDNQTVYRVEVHDYVKENSYRYIHPDYRDAYQAECREHGVTDEAYDDVEFIDLEMEEDFLEKCKAIMNYQDYDDRISIPIEFSDDELLEFMKAAHERDITFNQFIEEALRFSLEEFRCDPAGMTARAKAFLSEQGQDTHS